MSAILKVNYTHDAMIDILIANPAVSQADIARSFGYTQGWISQILSSDSFKFRLAERKKELCDPLVVKTLEERFEAVVRRSIDVVMEKLDTNPTADVALKGLELGAKALGYGAKVPTTVTQNNYIAVVPAKSASSKDWESSNRPVLPAIILEGSK